MAAHQADIAQKGGCRRCVSTAAENVAISA